MSRKAKLGEVKSYVLFFILQNHKDFNKYLAGQIQITKILSNHTITHITFGKSLDDKYTFQDAKALLAKYINFHRNKKSDYKISYLVTDNNNINLSDISIIKRDVFNIKNEDFAIRNYLGLVNKIHKGKSVKTPQKLQLGNGLVLVETQEKNKIKLDYNIVMPHTIATILGIDIVINNKATELMSYL